MVKIDDYWHKPDWSTQKGVKKLGKIIEIEARNIGVDSGTIAITDRKGRKCDRYQKVFRVPNGKYRVTWVMPNTWHGVVRGTGDLTVKTGEIIVSDPCYFEEFSDYTNNNWDRFLKRYDYFRKEIPGWVILDKHGGDGSFDVYIRLNKIG